MIIRRISMIGIVSALLLAGGCSNPAKTKQTENPETNYGKTTEAETQNQTETQKQSETAKETFGETEVLETTESDTDISEEITIQDMIADLQKDQYPELKMTAEIPLRKIILPGDLVTVAVVLENTGDKTVLFTHGSGSYETPGALMFEIDGLQPVLPEDYLGIATMDMQIKALEPGESRTFQVKVRAIQPNASFDEYTHELYKEDQTYIGDVELEKLQKSYPDLKTAESGSYTGQVYFLYTVADETGTEALFAETSGYAMAEFTIDIGE